MKMEKDPVTPIAVVGLSFRGPGDATNTEGLLRMVAEGRESRSQIPKHKWNHQAFYHPDASRHGTHNVEYGHWFEQDVYAFDAPFFNISASEAIALDPQQRMLLECSYEAFENSGTPMSEVVGTDTSVFTACFATDYTDMLWRDPETVPTYQCTNSGFSRANMANRLSFSFDLRGPSVTIDTACSGGLTALHLACQSLITGDAKQAIAAGSSLILGPDVMITMSMMKFLSPDGRCYAFDERANGYARGEGIAVLVLKRLDDALAHGDTIRAIIRGTGCNQDGKTPGITMPNVLSQEALIRSVYEKTGLNPLHTTYVECHGTGTQAGDTTETRALQKVFCADRELKSPLGIGSVKTNIGHLEGASGLAGIIKSILMLENGIILPHRNFEKANPQIPLREWGLRVPTTVETWNCSWPRRASVNSFGYGGANVHAILESTQDYLCERNIDPNTFIRRSALSVVEVQRALGHASENGHSNGHTNGRTNGYTISKSGTNGNISEGEGECEAKKKLFVLSAFDPIAGKAWAGKLEEYVHQRQQQGDTAILNDLAFTLSDRRTVHSWKAVVAASSCRQLIAQLADTHFVNVPPKNNLSFVFTGQGAQWCGMGKELIGDFPEFRGSLERCEAALIKLGASFNVIEELQKDFESSQVNKAEYSQPLCTALQIALIDLLKTWDVHPSSVTGHSSGEIAAAYCAGAISLEDAMLVAYARGSATTELALKGVNGAMAAVSMTREELVPLLSDLRNGKAVIACSNSPSSFTVSGDKSALDDLQQTLRARGIYNRRLVVGVAYHSHHMALVAESYRAAISNVQSRAGNDIDFFSSVTGKLTRKSDLGPDYWVKNLVSEVKFAQSLRQLAKYNSPSGTTQVQTLIELGPHAALAGPIRQIIQADEKLTASSIEYLSVLTRKKDAVTTILGLAANLFVSGHKLHISAVNGNRNSKIPPLIDLPPYAWNHTRSYSAESRISKAYRQRENPRTDLLGILDVHSSTLEPRWRQVIRLSELPWLRDHQIQSGIIYPAAGYITMAMEAVRQRTMLQSPGIQILGYHFRDVTISSALFIPESPGAVEVVITLKAFSDSVKSPSNLWDEFAVSSVSSENRWTEHCRGLVSVKLPPKVSNPVNGPAHEELIKATNHNLVADFNAACKRSLDVSNLYSHLSQIGMQYGSTFANIRQIRSAPNRCISQVEVPNTAAMMPMQYEQGSVIHPATLDSIFHTYLAALKEQASTLHSPVIPVCIEAMFIASDVPKRPGDMLTGYTSTTRKDNRFFSSEITVFDGTYDTGKGPVVHVGEMTMAALDNDSADIHSDRLPSRAFNLKWAPDLDLSSTEQVVDILHQMVSTQISENLDVDALGTGLGHLADTRVVACYLSLLAHKKPDQKVLALGSQIEPTMLALLSTLAELGNGVCPFRTLDCVDAGPDFDQIIESNFPSWADAINREYTTADISASQERYDVVLELNALGPEQDAVKPLRLASQLVVPGGRLLLVDPNLKIPGGHELPDIESTSAGENLARDLGSNRAQKLSEGVICFQLGQVKDPETNGTEAIIIVGDTNLPEVNLSHLEKQCQDLGIATEKVRLEDANPRPTQACIMLTELTSQVLNAPTTKQWESIKRIAHGSAGILWLTRGADGEICTNPDAALVQGLTRTIRSETGDQPVVTLDLDGVKPLDAKAAAECIADVFQRLVLSTGSMESELIERNGILHVSRLVEDIEASEKLQVDSSRRSQTKPSLRRLGDVGSSRLLVETPGLLDSLTFGPDERMNGELQSWQVEVDVRAAGINFKDVMMAMGQIQVEDLGCECSGIVSAVGDNVKRDNHGLRVGDRVMCLSQGSFCTKLRLDSKLAERIPDSMSFETAAAIPITHVTAYHSLYNIARLRKGETILIHAATGGLGQALVEMSQFVGAEVFVTVGSAEKKSFIMDRFGLADDRIFYSRDMSFAQDVMFATDSRGVDVIINSLAGEALRQSWTCIAPNGRFVELGQRDITINTRLDMAPFGRNASFTAFNLAYTMQNNPQAARDSFIEVLGQFARGELQGPDPLEIYAFSELQQAFRKMQTGRHMGKLVAVARPDDLVKHIAANTESPLFRPDAAYLLVGGLGGIGRATALWMASRGARHLIFLNRSGPDTQVAQETVAALQNASCTATVFACDVADASKLASTLEIARQQSPPIRGVIQGAMVLRDCMLNKLSLEDYLAVLRPKLHGTWNLHANLENLDFFLMESSISGIIGNTAQAAYAAANTFLDAFARYRRSNGQPATTIDIGAVAGVGYLAQKEDLKQAMQRQGFDFIDEGGLMRLLEFGIRNSTRDVRLAHIITGLGAWDPETSLAALGAPMFSRYRMLSSSVSKDKVSDTLNQTLRRCKGFDAGVEVILAGLVGQIVSHTGVPVENVSTKQSLQDYGIDSLAAVELKNWISKEMESVVPIFELMAAESLAVLAGKIAKRSRLIVSSNGL